MPKQAVLVVRETWDVRIRKRMTLHETGFTGFENNPGGLFQHSANRCGMVKQHDGFTDFVLDQLSDLHGVTCRAMFGGHGLYCGTVFFGIVHKGRLYFKTNATTAPRYREREMTPFRPSAKQALNSYYEVPVDILENAEELTIWAQQASNL